MSYLLFSDRYRYISTTCCKTARGKAVENLNKVRKCHANVGNVTKILPSQHYWISMNTITSTGFLTTDCLKSFFLEFLLNEGANLT